jgi:hypothetical protein
MNHCPAMRNGLIVYQNTSHLTASYAATFAPQMEEILRGFAWGSSKTVSSRLIGDDECKVIG